MGCLIKNRWLLLDLAERKGLPRIYDLLDKLQIKKGAVACTDGKIIYIDPDLFNNLSYESQFFILCHELLHIIYKHAEMRESDEFSDKELLNICQDVVINEYLQHKLKFKEPHGLYLDTVVDYLKQRQYIQKDSVIEYKGCLTTRQLYNFLEDRIPHYEADEFLDMLSQHKFDEVLENQAHALQEELLPLEVINQACDSLKLDKKIISREQGITIAEVTFSFAGIGDKGDPYGIPEGKVFSPREIINFCKDYVGTHAVIKGRSQTYSRPNRRIQSNDYVLRGYKNTKNIREIVIYLDTSGSMDSTFLSDMYTTLQTLFQTTKFRLFEFTTSIREVDLKSDRLYASGGTSINNVLRHIKQNSFDTSIMITDCEDDFSLEGVKSNLLIFTNNLDFEGDNPKVRVAYFR